MSQNLSQETQKSGARDRPRESEFSQGSQRTRTRALQELLMVDAPSEKSDADKNENGRGRACCFTSLSPAFVIVGDENIYEVLQGGGSGFFPPRPPGLPCLQSPGAA